MKLRALAPALFLAGCTSSTTPAPGGPPECGTGAYTWRAMIPGPGEMDHDASLAALARRYDRVFHGVSAKATGGNADVAIPLGASVVRARLAKFAAESDAWTGLDLETGTSSTTRPSWQKSAGLYTGAGIAADAFRYGTLRDQGASCDEIEVARAQLIRGMELLHVASAITGTPGVIARSLARTDVPGDGPSVTLVPLFDDQGAPLPAEKNNGTWRRDASGNHPSWVWEDSCSRDMLVGWAMAFAAIGEVADATLPSELVLALRADAAAIARSLMVKRERGYDLEIRDADGRTTFHGVMNEFGFERGYLDGVKNGFYAMMSLGIVAGLAEMAGAADVSTYLSDELIARRDLPGIVREGLGIIDMDVASNFSNYNMAFTAAWLAGRYVPDDRSRSSVRASVSTQLYAIPGGERQPAEQSMSLYDFVYAATLADVLPNGAARRALDTAAVARGVANLAQFPAAPYWELGRTNCDQAEIDAGACTLDDGTQVRLLGDAGRGGKLISDKPIPMKVRPPSNYHWRSNPYEPNGGGDGSRLLPGVDFRAAYWLGRWVRVAGE